MTQTDLLQNFMDSAEANVYLKDEEGRFLMVNRRVADMFGVSKVDVLGKTDYDFVSKEDADMFRENDRKVAGAGTAMSFTVTVTLSDGQHTFIDHKFPVSDVVGSANAVGGIAIEIPSNK